jgi:hypothetical protein
MGRQIFQKGNFYRLVLCGESECQSPITTYLLAPDFPLREPKPFKCSIKPRSKEAKKVIEALGQTLSFDVDA